MIKFEPLYYKEKLDIIHPYGDVGVVTLWTPTSQIKNKFVQAGINIDPQGSRIAAFGTLYGNGLPQLLRNLLYNPQIQYIIVCGRNRFQSKEALLGFFAHGVEEVSLFGSPRLRILGTDRYLDPGVTPHHFAHPPQLIDLGELSTTEGGAAIGECFKQLPQQAEHVTPDDRLSIPIPEVTVQWFPSEPREHTIIRRTPLEAWQEVIFRLHRFGVEVQLKKGLRRELQHVKVVIQEPTIEPEDELAKAGFSWQNIKNYQQDILNPILTEHELYTYGNRMLGYFKTDGMVINTLDLCAQQLQRDEQTRSAFVSLWDNSRDLWPQTRGHPCLVALFFRLFAGQLTLCATFRTHNALDGWLNNVYGLMAIQHYVATKVGMPTGAITIVSLSLTIDPAGGGAERAQKIAHAKKSDDVLDPKTQIIMPRLDPHGHFQITSDSETGEMLLYHMSEQGDKLAEYRGKTTEAIAKQLARDHAVSIFSHAFYLGREMARLEMQLAGQTKGDKP